MKNVSIPIMFIKIKYSRTQYGGDIHLGFSILEKDKHPKETLFTARHQRKGGHMEKKKKSTAARLLEDDDRARWMRKFADQVQGPAQLIIIIGVEQ